MIVHPFDEVAPFGELVSAMNLSPKSGDEGHVDDHGRLGLILNEVPNLGVQLFTFEYSGGAWQKLGPGETEWSPATFDDLRDMTEAYGAVLFSGASFADGETTHTALPEAVDDDTITGYPAGLIGSATVIGTVFALVSDLSQRVAVLEAAQA